jgi:hypothetical protein
LEQILLEYNMVSYSVRHTTPGQFSTSSVVGISDFVSQYSKLHAEPSVLFQAEAGLIQLVAIKVNIISQCIMDIT